MKINMVEPNPSKNAIDRLGDRLRDLVTPDDLRMLNAYRLSFASAYEVVLQQVRITYGLEVSGRPAKSTTAIVDKLKRESIRLSQMQDIAGCRVVVPDIAHQNALSEKLTALFSNVTIFDRRKETSHGYRAIHMVVQIENRQIEIQIRTEFQQLWAELSEKLSDEFSIAVKYGGGPDKIQKRLTALSNSISFVENLEKNAVVVQDYGGGFIVEDPKVGEIFIGSIKTEIQKALLALLETAKDKE
jgi:putative GTP pyrophosphokinase